MLRRNVIDLPVTQDLELSPGTYYLYFDASELLKEIDANPDWTSKLASKITEETGAPVDVSYINPGLLALLPGYSQVAVRLIVADPDQLASDVQTEAVPVIVWGAVALAIAAVTISVTQLKVKQIQKEIITEIPTEAIVNTSRGVYLTGVAILVAVFVWAFGVFS